MPAGLGNVLKQSESRLKGLDALRGLAAIAVVLFHYTTGYEFRFGSYASRPLFHFPNGHFGVELFFIISGFVILGTLERSPSVRDFAVARFARLYPAYIVCAMLTLLVIRMTHMQPPDLNARALVVNAAMLTNLTELPFIDPSYWTLTYEVLFYAAAALVYFFLGVGTRAETPCLAWLSCSLVGHIVHLNAYHSISVLLNIEYAYLFVMGMMLYYISQGSLTPLTIPTLAAALLMTLFPPEWNGGNMPQLAFIAMIASFAAAVWLVSARKSKLLDFAPLVFIGEVSYSLYLVHQIVGYSVIQRLVNMGIHSNVAIVTGIALMLALAYFIRLFVEKPVGRWIRSSFKTRAERVDPTPAAPRVDATLA